MNEEITPKNTPETFEQYTTIRFDKYCNILKILPLPKKPLNVRHECSSYQLKNFDDRNND